MGNVTEVQLRWRTLAGFSTDAEQKMSGQVIFYLKKFPARNLVHFLTLLQAMFELYREYYSGPPDYADEVNV